MNKHLIFWKKLLLTLTGTFFLILGFLGIFLPLLPIVPFLLLTAWCYGKSSPALYNKLMRYAWFRYYIRSYMEGRGVSAKVKIVTVSLLWISGFFFSSTFY